MNDLPTAAEFGPGDTPVPRGGVRPAELPLAALVEELRLDQQARWSKGDRVSVETYLEQHPTLCTDPEALLDLIYSEFAQRVLHGEKPTPEEYMSRFPEHRARLERQFAVHELLIADGALPEAATVPDMGDDLPPMVGKYRVIALIAESGQATVYRAVHPTLGLDVAIKLGRQPLHPNADRDRLLREGRMLAELEHPGLARVYDFDLHEGRPFLVMEYVRGRNLEQDIKQGVSPRVAAERVARVSEALAVVHRAGIIHHDVKPRNILIDPAGQPRLIDFGLSLLRSAWAEETAPTGSVWGSAQFMAPEQARGETARIGPQTDLFALGGVLYFLLVGRPPYPGEQFSDVLDRARRGAWDRASLQRARVPRRLKAICARAMAAEPEQRYGRAEYLAVDLRRWLRRRWLIGGALTAAAAILVALAPIWGSGEPPSRPNPGPASSAVAQLRPLQIQVWLDSKRRYTSDLTDAVPLRTGVELRISGMVPAGMYGSLFAVNAEGQVRLLREAAPADAEQELSFPQDPNQSIRLRGPIGTEVVLVCARRAAPVTAAEVQQWWTTSGSWPTLPNDIVLRLLGDAVVRDTKTRDFDPARDRPDPEGEVRRRLETVRNQLRQHVDYFEGVAFPHQK